PKSNASYLGLERAREAVAAHGSLPVPMHLRNAPTGLMRHLGYGEGYEYAHDAPDAFVAAPNLPEALGNAEFYAPTERGAERAVVAAAGGGGGRRARRAPRRPARPPRRPPPRWRAWGLAAGAGFSTAIRPPGWESETRVSDLSPRPARRSRRGCGRGASLRR